MAWPRGNPVEEIDRLVTQHRADQVAQEQLCNEAVDAEQRALGALQAAQALQLRAKDAIELDVAEIDRLLLERTIYVPLPRTAEE